MRCWALVPAAGLSRRMGQPKLALPLGSRVVLEHVVDRLLEADLDGVLVVLGPATADLADRVPRPARCLILGEQTPQMRQTVAAGLDWLESEIGLGPGDCVLLALADQPTLRRETILALKQTHLRDPERILLPTFEGRRGHPLLLPWKWVSRLRVLPGDVGIDFLIRQAGEDVGLVEVEDPEIRADMDEPADYHRLQQRPWT